MNQPNRGVQHYSHQRRQPSRIRELARKHWGKIALAGVAIAALGGKPTYRYYREHTLPRGIVVTTHHGDAEDGSRVVQELRKAIKERKVGVVAFESSFATAGPNRILQENIQEVQILIRQWRAEGYSNQEISRRLAPIWEVFFNPAWAVVAAEAVTQGIPLRLLENMSERQAAQLKSINQRMSQGFTNLKKESTLEKARQVMDRITSDYDKLERERDKEMSEEMSKIRDEFRGKGGVFAVVGEKHFDVAKASRLEQINVAHETRKRYFQLDSMEERKMSPELRSLRNVVLFHLDAYGYKGTTTQRQIASRAAEKIRNLTATDYEHINAKFGNLTFNERAEKIALEYGK